MPRRSALLGGQQTADRALVVSAAASARSLIFIGARSGELPSFSFDQYLERGLISDARREFVVGRVYDMAGSTERHDLAAGLIYEALAPGARAQGCRPFAGTRRVRTAGAAYYPDVLVACGPAAHRLYETDAAVILEVLSRPTAPTDRREKATQYAQLPGLCLYLLVDPDDRRVEVDVIDPDGGLNWRAFGPGTVVPTRYGDLDVDGLYDALDATATMT